MPLTSGGEVEWSVTTGYMADGSRIVSEFKGGYELAKESFYDAAGTVIEEKVYIA